MIPACWYGCFKFLMHQEAITMAKKTTTKKTTARATAAKAAKPKASKLKVPEKPATKSEILATIAEHAELSKKQVTAVFDVLNQIIEKHLGRRGPGEFTLPGLMKLTVQKKPATRARKGINPFTKEEIMIKAKPARKVVKVRPLKNLKDMAQ